MVETIPGAKGRMHDVPLTGFYQDKLAPALDERLALIEKAIPESASSVLDIGCNLGDITAHFARRGMWSIGLDSSRQLIDVALERQRGVVDCGLMVSAVTPANVDRLPTFDVILLLSVHHHWLGTHGPDVAGAMLRTIVAKARDLVVFESASRNVRFGTFPPGFTDNDEISVTAYHEKYLRAFVGDVCDIEMLGKTPCVGAREPYRWSWAIRPRR